MSISNNWKSVNQYSYSSGPSYLQQLRCVMWRSWITNIREPMLVKIKFIQTVVRLEIVWEIIIQSIIKFTWPWQKWFIYLMWKQMNFLILLLMVNHNYFLIRVFFNSYYYLWMFIRMLFYFQPFFSFRFSLCLWDWFIWRQTTITFKKTLWISMELSFFLSLVILTTICFLY